MKIQNQARNDSRFIAVLRRSFDGMCGELNEKKLCVCLSGGADSVALLRGCEMLSGEYGFSLCACHFNHMIRGAEADRDETFCKALCESRGIELFRGRDDVPEYARVFKCSLEEAARICRYAFFERLLESKRFDYYATAHNMNDDAETLIMNLVRGSGSNGASSVSARNGRLLRPMLAASRDDVELFLESVGQAHIYDSTNDSTEYTRNYIRKVIIPEMQNINPRVVEALSAFADSAREDRVFFDSLVDKESDSDLRKLPDAILKRVVLRKYKDYSGRIANGEQIGMIVSAVKKGKRAVIPLCGEIEVIVDEGKLSFVNGIESVPVYPEAVLCIGENSIFGGRVTAFYENFPAAHANFNNLSTHQRLDFDNICGELCVRQRNVGDKITVFGINKSVKKLFIEKKIPVEFRNIIPVYFDSKGIVYIPFVGVSDRAYPNNSYNTVEITTVFNSIEKERWRKAYEK